MISAQEMLSIFSFNCQLSRHFLQALIQLHNAKQYFFFFKLEFLESVFLLSLLDTGSWIQGC